MPPSDEFGEKTERATGRRRMRARRKGKVAMSPEVGSAAVLLIVLLVLWLYGPHLRQELMTVCRANYMTLAREDLTVAGGAQVLADALWRILRILAPMLLGMIIVGMAAATAQVGFHLSADKLIPDLNAFNPVAGMKKLISLRSVVTLLTSTVKLVALLLVSYVTVRAHAPLIASLFHATPARIASTISRATLDLGFRAALVLTVIAAIDYAYQKWQYEKDLRMTKEEVKEERKLLEGRPETKRRIRSIQFRMARCRMLNSVKEADVVIKNPTHYAIALKYDAAKSAAPVVLAKGLNHLAKRILETAARHRVPTVRDAPLARALYRSVEVGEEIPVKLYRAVAKLLVHIYQLRRKRPQVAI